MTPDQLPDSLQLRNRVRSLALLDLVLAPAKPFLQYTDDEAERTQTAALSPDDDTLWTMLFTRDGATLSLDGTDTVLASTLDQPVWQSSGPAPELPDLLDGSPESVQTWLKTRSGRQVDAVPIEQILQSVPLTVDLARNLGSDRPWPELRDAALRIGYPVPDEDLPGPDNPNAGATTD